MWLKHKGQWLPSHVTGATAADVSFASVYGEVGVCVWVCGGGGGGREDSAKERCRGESRRLNGGIT